MHYIVMKIHCWKNHGIVFLNFSGDPVYRKAFLFQIYYNQRKKHVMKHVVCGLERWFSSFDWPIATRSAF